MPFARTFVLAFFSLLAVFPTLAQQASTPVQRDPQAIAILTQSLNAAGGILAVSAIQDVTATGTITYNAEDQSPQGSATIKLLGLHRFRLDASLPDGVHSCVVGKENTFHKDPDGSVSAMAPQNIIKPTSLPFPFFHVLAAVQDASYSITYGGLVTRNGQQVHDILAQKTFSRKEDPSGRLTNVAKANLYIDPTALTVLGIEDRAYRRDGEPGDVSHEIQFGNYQIINGISVPLTVIEFLGGQKLSTIQLTQITFNTGLAESDFQ